MFLSRSSQQPLQQLFANVKYGALFVTPSPQHLLEDEHETSLRRDYDHILNSPICRDFGIEGVFLVEVGRSLLVVLDSNALAEILGDKIGFSLHVNCADARADQLGKREFSHELLPPEKYKNRGSYHYLFRFV